MQRLLVATLALTAFVGCSQPPLQGRLVDAMRADAPVANETLVARATGKVRMTCQTLSGKTDDHGHFSIPDLCLSETSYKITPSNSSLFLAEAQPISDASSEVILKAWWAPEGDGSYLLHGQSLSRLKTHADLKDVVVPPSGTKVLYPATMPSKAPQIPAGDDLVLTGKSTIDKTRIVPLVHSDARTFGDTKLEPWWYVGVKFDNDTDFSSVNAKPDPGHVTDIAKGDRVARFIDGAALPAGRYAIYREGGRRVSIVQFGESSEKTAAQ